MASGGKQLRRGDRNPLSNVVDKLKLKRMKDISKRMERFLGITVIAIAAEATPSAQAQDGDNCRSGTIDCEPSFTPQLPSDCLELWDQAYREERKDATQGARKF